MANTILITTSGLVGLQIAPHPAMATVPLASQFLGTMLAIFLFLRGIIQIQGAFAVKPENGWGWLLFGGILAILLGVLLMMKWPIGGMLAIGIFIGIELLFSGITVLMFGGDLRRAAKAQGG